MATARLTKQMPESFVDLGMLLDVFHEPCSWWRSGTAHARLVRVYKGGSGNDFAVGEAHCPDCGVRGYVVLNTERG